jgi:hypothetical protein
MPTATITIERLTQDPQDAKSGHTHQISRVFFMLDVEGKKYPNLYADIKSPIAGSLESSSLEVSKPHHYDGPFNYEAFRVIIEQYYRGLLENIGSGSPISSGSSLIKSNNTFVQMMTAHLEVPESIGS